MSIRNFYPGTVYFHYTDPWLCSRRYLIEYDDTMYTVLDLNGKNKGKVFTIQRSSFMKWVDQCIDNGVTVEEDVMIIEVDKHYGSKSVYTHYPHNLESPKNQSVDKNVDTMLKVVSKTSVDGTKIKNIQTGTIVKNLEGQIFLITKSPASSLGSCEGDSQRLLIDMKTFDVRLIDKEVEGLYQVCKSTLAIE